MTVATASISVEHDEDPREKLLKAVGKRADNLKPLWGQVLVAVYNRAGYDGSEVKTKGGILLLQKTTEEDLWQGKVGLVLALGPYAFRDDKGEIIPGSPKVGDWVHFRVGDTLGSLSGKLMLRFFDHEATRGIVEDPDELF